LKDGGEDHLSDESSNCDTFHVTLFPFIPNFLVIVVVLLLVVVVILLVVVVVLLVVVVVLLLLLTYRLH
jgi:hypothetical protein